MRVNIHRFVASTLCFVTALLFNCSEEAVNYFEEENIIENGGLGQMEAYDALEVDYLAEFNFTHTNVNSLVSECVTFKNDPDSKTVEMTFGCTTPTASKFPLARVRSGTIYVKYETVVGDSLSSRIITFNNYYVSSKKLEGTLRIDSIHRQGGVQNSIQSVCHFSKFKVTYPNGTSVEFSGSQKRVWTSGEGDSNPINNTYLISSSTDSLYESGPVRHSFVPHISSPITLSYACASSGVFAAGSGAVRVSDISGYGGDVGTVNYGDGACEKNVSITTAQRTYTISVN